MKNRYRNKDAHARRKVGADARKAEYDKLTVQQKLDRNPGTKERAKLERKLNKKFPLSADQLAEMEGDAVVFASNPKHLKKN